VVLSLNLQSLERHSMLGVPKGSQHLQSLPRCVKSTPTLALALVVALLGVKPGLSQTHLKHQSWVPSTSWSIDFPKSCRRPARRAIRVS